MSSFGKLYRVVTFGESHSSNVGCVVEGFPANIKIDQSYVQYHLDRRRPGQSSLTTPRKEEDKVRFLSGLNQQNYSLGSPITMIVDNLNIKAQDYSEFDQIPRPGHADFTYQKKYAIRSESGGGRSSARETVGRVCAGALAQSYLKDYLGVQISAWVSSIGNISIPQEVQKELILKPPSQKLIDQMGQFCIFQKEGLTYYKNEYYENKYHNLVQSLRSNDDPEVVNVRCPHPESAVEMIKCIEQVKLLQDSIGGIITCCITGPPAGLGEPCFDKLPALLAHAMLSIPAVKGFEIGSGFEGTKLNGSQHNDLFCKADDDNTIKPKTNHAGGTLGGISTGETIYFNVAFKPVSTIGLEQLTVDTLGNPVTLKAKGRHDPCVLPRAPPIVESMAALVIMDLHLIQQSQKPRSIFYQHQPSYDAELNQVVDESVLTLIMEHCSCDRQVAIQALKESNYDTVNAILKIMK